MADECAHSQAKGEAATAVWPQVRPDGEAPWLLASPWAWHVEVVPLARSEEQVAGGGEQQGLEESSGQP